MPEYLNLLILQPKYYPSVIIDHIMAIPDIYYSLNGTKGCQKVNIGYAEGQGSSTFEVALRRACTISATIWLVESVI